MMFHRLLSCICGGLGIAAVCAAPVAARPLAQVRIHSLKAMMADVEAVSAAAGKPVRGETLVAQLLAQVGIVDPGLVDPNRPVVAILPLEGMLLQQRGVVLALPVVAARPLLDAVATRYLGRVREGDLEVFSDAAGAALYALERDGYVVAGQTRDFVAGFDLGLVDDGWDGPPGNLVAELFLEPLMPLIQAGLMSARQKARQELQQGLDQPRSGPIGTPPVDGTAVAELFDLYLGAVQTVLLDLSRTQISLQVGGGHLSYHHRLVAKQGTATAEFVAQQGGGLPSFSRVVPPGAVSVVGQVRMTPRLQQTLAELMRSYLQFAGQLLAGAEPGAAPVGLLEYLDTTGKMMVEVLPCLTGEMVAGIDFSLLAGMNVAEVVGVVDTPECRAVTERSLAQLRTLGSKGTEAVPLRFGGEEVIHGVTAQRYTSDMTATQARLQPQEREVMQLIYGGTQLLSYIASTGPATYYAVGSEARTQLGAMLAADRNGGHVGMEAATFLPLSPGPGVFASVELRKVLDFVLELTPADDPGRVRLEQVLGLLSKDEGAGRVAFGFRFDPHGGVFQLALPLRALAARQQLQPLPAKATVQGE